MTDRAALVDALGRMAAGDRAALKLFYSATSAKLFGVILRILNDRSEAEDVFPYRSMLLATWSSRRPRRSWTVRRMRALAW